MLINMDDSSAQLGGVQNSSSQLGGSGNSIGLNNKGDGSNNAASSHEQIYTIPGVLHFIQHEFSRFEIERSQWDVDRAELQAKIAVLLGERKGQESLKSDLIRRIKMLEYALVQERAKLHRLKYGCDPSSINEVSPPTDEPNITNEVAPDSEAPFSSVSNATWRQGRQLLRSYLQEIGYTDTIIDVRSNRVRSLLGLTNGSEQEENVNPNVVANEGTKRASESQGRRTPAKKTQPSMAEAMILDQEAAVMANFEFLGTADVEMSDDDGISDDLDMVVGNENNSQTTMRKAKAMHDDVDAEAEEVLNELNSLTEGEENNTNSGKNAVYPNADVRRTLRVGKDEDVDGSLGLGELAQLTVNNEAETAYDVGNAKDSSYRKTWNAKYTLRSHFDGVRALAFHPQEPVLVTVSEDHTLKLWNLQKTVFTKKSAGLDVEPLYTFRAHTSPVLCLAMSTNGEQCFSGGLDGTIICWNIPNSNIDPYDSYDESVLHSTLTGHTDAVWGLTVNPTNGHLASCSADGTVKIWSPKTLLQTITGDDNVIPTSVDFVHDEPDRIVVAFDNGSCIIYNTETANEVVKLNTGQETNGNSGKFINKVVCHPTLPVTITAHEDRHIRFWDNTNGTLIHFMVAHLEPVTSLAIDSHGLYLLSGSHDCSIRLWNFDNKTCVQEITAHRKKFDESIFDVAFHPSRPYIASAGADALAKVFI